MALDHTWCVMPVAGDTQLYTEAAIADLLAQSVPTKILVIAQGVERAYRDRLEALAEAYPDRVFVWTHDPPLPSLSATWNRALEFVWRVGGEEALVINNDVRVVRETVRILHDVLHRMSALFVSAVGVTETQFAAFQQVPEAEIDNIIWNVPGEDLGTKGGPDFSCFLLSRSGHTKYPFDEGFVPAYCVAPDTPVLTEDLRWVPIGGVKVGDRLVGVDEHELPRTKGTYRRRCYRISTVTSVSRRRAPCLQLWLADGRGVICSIDHKWLTKYPSGGTSYRWRAASDLSIGYRIAAPVDVWQAPSTYEHGWLAGRIDGEGTLRMTAGNRCEINISQKKGPILDEIKIMLARCGVPFTWRIRTESSVGTVEIGIRRHVLRVLGEFRPKRLLAKMEWKDLSLF